MISGFSLSSQIFMFFSQVLSIYNYLIIARILLGWFINSYMLERHVVGYWLCVLTDPALRFFRRLPFAVIGGIIDISPLFLLFAISIVQDFLRAMIHTQSASVVVVLMGMLFSLIIQIISIVKTGMLVIAIISFFRLLYLLFSSKNPYNSVLSHIDSYIVKAHKYVLSFLHLSKFSFTMQVLSLFIISSLLFYMMALGQEILGGYLTSLLISMG